MHSHQEVLELHPVRGPLVVLAVLGSHEELAGRDQREVRQHVSRHRSVTG
jgi:hypothetical protein